MQKRHTIYKATNVITGKSYIGQTVHTVKRRFQWHTYKAYKGKDDSPLHKAIAQYGADNFTVEILDTDIPDERVDDCERYWIRRFNTIIPNGYNVQLGGKKSFDVAPVKYDGGRYGYSSHGKITMCDLNTGNEIMVFSGVMDAERYLRANGYEKANHWPITKCCQGKQKYAYGHKWKFHNANDAL